ncbi:MAG TPA: ABC transporter ATP-binding protein [Xanthobacteraceae bacterium]|nr:ABC transporter ATP-binding protein [Xanthobacteraceae bacterium]
MTTSKVKQGEKPYLQVENVYLKFGGLAVLDAISLAVASGELLALIGPNGAGKTSVFNCISGLYRPTSGRILIQGTDIRGMRPDAISRLGLARTFQHGELFQHMSVLDNLLAARHGKVRTNALAELLLLPSVRNEEARHRAAVDRIIAFVELERYRDVKVGDLPFGLQKLIGFARALAAEPTLLLLDEPSAGLSREEREDLAYFILKAKQDLDLAVIWIEHDMQMIADLADRIHVLDYGRSLADGPPADVLSDENVIRAYLGQDFSID